MKKNYLPKEIVHLAISCLKVRRKKHLRVLGTIRSLSGRLGGKVLIGSGRRRNRGNSAICCREKVSHPKGKKYNVVRVD